jgi:hypothetical protein
MARKIFLGIRIDPDLKKALEQVGRIEERSVSQVCELLLRNGVEAYKSRGPGYIRAARKPKEVEPE